MSEAPRGMEVPLQSAQPALTLHSSLPPFPLPHISTFQHTDTVTARTDFHSKAHGQWAACQPLAICPPVNLTLLHNDKLGLLRRLSSDEGACFRPPGAFMLTENTLAVCVILVHNGNSLKKFVKKRALWFSSLCLPSLVFSEGVFIRHNDNAPGVSCRHLLFQGKHHNLWENDTGKATSINNK